MKKLIIPAVMGLFIIAYAFAQPQINSIVDSPDPVEVPGYNNITANITNATSVYVEIYYPNATLMGNYSMTNIASTQIWYYNTTYAYPKPLGNYSYIVKAYNSTGWNVSSSYNITVQDTTPPSSSINSIPYWYNVSNITINATASDNYHVSNVSLWYRHSTDNSTWDSWTLYATDLTTPWGWNFTGIDGFYQFYTIATDDAGNKESKTTADEIAAIDTTPPSSSISASPIHGNHITSSSTITISSTDTTSGVNVTYYRTWNGTWSPAPGTGAGIGNNYSVYSGSFSLTGEGTHYVEYYSVDNLGNVEAIHNVTYIVDDSGPTIYCINATPHVQTVGGYVNITCCINDISDVDGSSVYVHIDYPDGSSANFTMHTPNCYTFYRNESFNAIGLYNFTIYAKDYLGNENVSSVHNFTIQQDTTPPVTTCTLDPATPNGNNGWYITPVNVTIDATDDSSGVKATYYCVDAGTWHNITVPYTFTISTYGVHTIQYYSVDNAGNTESAKSTTVKIDAGHPITTYSLSPSTPDGKNGWYVSNVKVTLNATDPDGVAYTKYRIDSGTWIVYNGSFNITTDGNHLLEFYSVDTLGKAEPIKSTHIKIDKTAPTGMLQRPMPSYLYIFDRQIMPLAGGTSIAIGHLTVRVIAYDDTSGIENVTFYLNNVVQTIDLASPYEWIWAGDIGTRALKARVYNGAGLYTDTIVVNVFIISL
ncbi:MAG: hypothetical protein J7K61_03895 [Thermoplasmata archaeon]|nr:hypothetical protein [Thermoplasmata archaeon]